MSFTRMLLAAAVLAIAACNNPTAATDCVYDKTAAAAPGNQLCSPSSTIGSELPVVDGGAE
jgi:hypothetical protein